MRILNLGCGKQVYGDDFVDLYPTRDNVKKYDADNEALPYPNNTFDEVYSRGVFEHLTNPNNMLKEVYRVLKPGGTLILTTDNALYYGIWLPFWDLHMHNYPGKYGEFDKHYMIFTEKHLLNWMRRFNFTLDRIEYQQAPNNNKIKTILKQIAYLFLPKKYSCLWLVLTAKKPELII